MSSLPILYSFRRCPFAMRARLALAASETEVELREVVLRDKPAEMLAASPKGTVPVLLVGNTVIDQSLDIMHWALSRNDPQSWLQPEQESLDAMLGLIACCDGDFKIHLDRYKYPERYPGEDPLAHRAAACQLLGAFDERLSQHPWLFGSRPALADFAVAPFVRQFAHVDKDWFAAQPWPHLQAWLEAFLQSPLFARVMTKYSRWESGAAGVRFPAG